MLLIVLYLFLAVTSFAQEFDLETVPQFGYGDEVTLSGSAVKWTLQLPAKSERSGYIAGVSVYCSAGCTLVQYKNGTAASATEVAGIPLNLPQTPTLKFYKNSDSTGGEAFTPIAIPAGPPFPLSVKVVLRRSTDAAQNYTFAVTGASGTGRIYLITAEKGR